MLSIKVAEKPPIKRLLKNFARFYETPEVFFDTLLEWHLLENKKVYSTEGSRISKKWKRLKPATRKKKRKARFQKPNKFSGFTYRQLTTGKHAHFKKMRKKAVLKLGAYRGPVKSKMAHPYHAIDKLRPIALKSPINRQMRALDLLVQKTVDKIDKKLVT